MEIIEHGRPVSECFKETKLFKCSYCGCKFEANEDEYKYVTQYNEIYYYCQCPECSQNADETSR